MKTQIISTSKKQKNAFTLIEIMVATVIMIILTGLVIQITSEVLKVWNRSSGKLAANAEARIAMDLLTQDLETAVFRNNEMRWLEASQEALGDPFSGESTSFQTTKLKLFSPAMDRPSGAGDICGISYLLSYSDPISGAESGNNRTFILYRNLINPGETFNDLMGAGQQETFNNPKWQDAQTVGGGENYLVSNVVDFRIDFYLADEDGTKVPGNTLFGGTSATVGSDAANASYRYPLLYADITLKVISDEALQVVQQGVPIAQTGFDSWAKYIAANSEVFTRRINFLARPL